jgi:hypothetical protein
MRDEEGEGLSYSHATGMRPWSLSSGVEVIDEEQ